MAKLDILTITAPSAWATYLINGDDSGLEEDEIRACDAFIARQGVGSPVSCEEAGFVTWHDARQECPYAADCQDYVFLLESFQ